VAEAALIIRVSKKNRYSIISNVPINDERLSWESSGLHTWLMSKPDTWEVNREAIVAVRKAGRDKVTRMLAELENCGYLTREKHRGADGRFRWISVLYEEPIHENHGGKTVDGFSALDTGKPSTAEPSLDKPATGKAPLLNTDRAIPDSGKTESSTHTSDLASPSEKAKEPEAEAAFASAWREYPKRPGNPEKPAREQFFATLDRGIASELLVASVKAYSAHCREQGIAGTRFVMQAKKFFGVDEEWREFSETKPAPSTDSTPRCCTHGSCPPERCNYTRRNSDADDRAVDFNRELEQVEMRAALRANG
jgi:hypothetical protein